MTVSLLIVATALFAYVAARAIHVPLTYDEAASYIRYVASDPLATFSFVVATNHFLQTVLTRLAAGVLGNTELVLRLPSLLAYAIYLAFSYALVRRLRSPWLAIAGFLLLNANPYLLDYFALARGYALSLALLMAAMYYLIELLDPRAAHDRARLLARSLAAGGLAVLANFAALNVFLAIAAIAVAGLYGREAGDTVHAARPSRTRRAARGLWLPLSAVMSVLVFSQDPDLSPRLFEPVSVTIGGLDAPQLARIQVLRVDTRERTRPLERDGATWRLPEPMHVAALRVQAPPDVAAAIERIDTVIGSRVFGYSRTSPGPWRSTEGAGLQVLESPEVLSLRRPRTPALRGIANWRGEGVHLEVLARYTLAVVTATLILAALLLLVGAGLSHAGMIRRGDWAIVSTALCWVAAFVTAPLYLLTRKEELYFGGTDGFIPDTLGSLVLGTLYGRGPSAPAMTLGFAAVLILVLLLLALGAVFFRSGRTRPTAAVAVLGVFSLAAAAAVLQHHLLGTPYPVGRTALVFGPLIVAFGVLVLDAVTTLGRGADPAAVTVAGAAAVAAALHLAATANLSVVRDWRHDASTRAMVADLVDDADADLARGSTVSLGVAPVYFPVATYYASRVHHFTLAVTASTDPFRSHYIYMPSGSRPPSSRILAAYPRTGTVLLTGRDR